jgi:hypothetical protein
VAFNPTWQAEAPAPLLHDNVVQVNVVQINVVHDNVVHDNVVQTLSSANRSLMSISTPFINRPVATTLLTTALALAGAIAYTFLPVSPIPQVEFPTISVQAALPGASPWPLP